MAHQLVTLERHIIEEERRHAGASGDLSGLLSDLVIAIKVIHREVNKAGLVDILGETEDVNIHGEIQKRLDIFAQEQIFKALDHTGRLCVMASEEEDDIIKIPKRFPKGKYVIVFDPLDGSSNIDANVSIGTILSVYKKKDPGEDGTLGDCLRQGVEQVAALYVIYGSSTMLVYTTGDGVHGFTLDTSLGIFMLSHPDIQTPKRGKIYSINEGNTSKFDAGTLKFLEYVKTPDEATGRPYSSRYIGSLVADFHRNLLYGGIFLYPGVPRPKLRLLYEANPLAFIAEQAGGRASTGTERVMEIQATDLHQRVPLIIGSEEDVLLYEKFFKEGGGE